MSEKKLKSPEEFDCIQNFLTEMTDTHCDRSFLVLHDEGLRFSFMEIMELWKRGAAFLQSQGICKDDKLVIALGNSAEYIIALGSAFLAGAVPVLINPTTGQEQLKELAIHCGAKYVVSYRHIDGLFYQNPSDFSPSKIAKLNAGYANVTSRQDEIAYILFTSGSTGRMKGTQITHNNVLTELGSLIRAYKLTKDDKHLCVLPLYHVSALFRNFLMPFSLGAETVILKEFDPTYFWKLIEKFQIAFVQIVPTIISVLYETSDISSANAIRSLKYIGTAAAPCPPDLIRKFEENFGVLVVQGYGLTESTCGATVNPLTKEERRLHSAGLPIDIARIEIIDKNGSPLPPNQEGEIKVSGPLVSPGYIQPEEQRKNALKNGSVMTGDIGYKDEDGFIYIVGRKTDLIYRGGFKISPKEVEEQLAGHPNIIIAVVFGVPHRSWGEDIIAYIKPKNKDMFVESQIRAFLTDKLMNYKIPTRIISAPELFNEQKFKLLRNVFKNHYLESQGRHIHAAPRTELEQLLAEMWQDVLSVGNIGIHDNFFELGGDSIRGTIFINELQTQVQEVIQADALFNAPTISELVEYLDEHHHEAVKKMSGFEINTGMAETSGYKSRILQNKAEKSDTYPMSFGQERLWFLHQLEPASPVYNIPFALRLSGRLNVDAFRESLTEIVRRHDILRTTFDIKDKHFVQIVSPSMTLPLQIINLRHLPDFKREAEAKRIAEEEVQQPFDLNKGPLLKLILFQLKEEEHLLVITFHHIIIDGWSMSIFIQELSTLYEAFSAEKPSPLPKLPVQYADYTIWQHERLQGKLLETKLAYWKKQLLEIPPVLNLPTDRPRPPIQTFRGNRMSFQIQSGITEALKALSQQSEMTLHMIMAAAFAALLFRYSGQKDIVFGAPVANRNQKEIEPLIGFFVNTLALRTNFSDNPTFIELLKRVRQTLLEAYAHQDIPFGTIVESLQPDRNLSYSPLFQVMLVFQNEPMVVPKFPGLTASPVEIETGTARFDLTLFLTETGQTGKSDTTAVMAGFFQTLLEGNAADPKETGHGMTGRFEYNTDLFDESTITRMAGHFQTLLEGIAAAPNRHISDLPILTETERHQILTEWNNTEVNYPFDVSIHQLFEDQVKRTPDAVAVVFENARLTYQELNQRANQVAHYLLSSGAGTEKLVGICIERSLEMVVGLLGILKSGSAYVPLDPAFPKTRLAFMLEDSQLSVLLTQKRLVEHLPTHQTNTVFIDCDWEENAKKSSENPVSKTSGNNIAYVIYTSGSTGKPKGVQIPHSALTNFLFSMREKPGLTEKDTLMAVTTLSFDIAGLELFLPLIVGARLVVVSREASIDGKRLAEEITTNGVTVMQATPTTWRLMVESGWHGADNLKALCGGEPLPLSLAGQLLERVESLWNMYGPTETTIWSGIHKIEFEDTLIPIGFPIANTTFYILDAHLYPVPAGIPGELYIGGAGLAQGYLKQPELTKEKFIPNPFSLVPGARLYKTGDRVRYLPDGSIEFLGRIDFQVKVRGFRIELGEIEAALAGHPAVKETIVIAREDHAGDKYLAAYIVPNRDQMPSVSELHRFLKEKLPDYMIPSAFVMLRMFPVTPNSKIDRLALPAPEHIRPKLNVEYVKPRSELEQCIADIWQEVLQVNSVGIHDNFFDLGGYSSLTVQIHRKLQEKTGYELSVIDMFEYPTISALAQHITSKNHARFSSESGIERSKKRIDFEVSTKRTSQFRKTIRHHVRKKQTQDE